MCGIFGYISKGNVPQEAHEAVTKMFVATQARGRDASGFAYLDESDKLQYHKAPVTATELVNSDEFKSLSNHMPRMLIGHCRLKTQGNVKDNVNNHPIVDRKFGWAVIHNGVIQNDDELFKKYKMKRDGEVDSEVILRLFQKNMLEDIKVKPMSAIKKTVSEISGSLTFGLIGEECPNTLYLYKASNPLVLVYVEKWGMIFFGSKEEFITAGLTKLKLRVNGFFAKRRRIVDYMVNDKIADETALRISVEGGEFSIRAINAEKKRYKYAFDKRGQSSFIDDEESYNFDENGKYRIGAGYRQLPDGTVERVQSPLKLVYNKDEEIGDMMV